MDGRQANAARCAWEEVSNNELEGSVFEHDCSALTMRTLDGDLGDRSGNQGMTQSLRERLSYDSVS